MQLIEYDIECLNTAKYLIEADMTRHYTIPEIAAYTGMSSTKLKAGFKKLFGVGLYQYLKEQRLSKGKCLIENTPKTLKEISHILGYKHTCNFITAYKNKYKTSPGQQRNSDLKSIQQKVSL